ncbi:MAG TPA: toxin-antitoxin system YwqK family antitoxin [Bacteroidales bacterium]|nr:toxin-antitoxin system YwqK family antitoxin [Bacteroidales bacterium]
MKRIAFFLSVLMIAPVFLFSQGTPQKNDTLNRLNGQGQKSGYWEEQMADQLAKGYYLNNNKTGCWITQLANNLLVRIDNYSNGKKDGVSITFDRRNRILGQENYKNGLLDGVSINYNNYNEFPLTEIYYSKGKKNGSSKIYYDNGKIQEEATFKDEAKNGTVRWYNRAGKVMAEYYYVNGMFEGIQKTFYENDTLQSFANYSNNNYAGGYQEFYRNGKLKLTGQYVNGLKEGEWIECDETGKAVKKTKFKNGVSK